MLCVVHPLIILPFRRRTQCYRYCRKNNTTNKTKKTYEDSVKINVEFPMCQSKKRKKEEKRKKKT